jgi:hypothetical protein
MFLADFYIHMQSNFRSWVSRSVRVLCVAAGVALTGCASVYVDTATREVADTEIKRPAIALPAALVFDFQTNGAPNAAASRFLKDQVAAQVEKSGLFQVVPTAGGNTALLNITINNVPITKDAAQQGFVTGLTFGLAGSAVTDGYICTVSYVPADGSPTVSSTARHAIHTTMGNATAPANGVKSASTEEAVRTMARQIIANALRDLSTNPQLK